MKMDISGDRIFQALGGRKVGANKWRCFCPSHDDGRNPSLSLTDNGERVLWNCFGGCSSLEVKSALIDRGLFPEKGRSRPKQDYLSDDQIEYMRLYNAIFKADNQRGQGHSQAEIDKYIRNREILRRIDGS